MNILLPISIGVCAFTLIWAIYLYFRIRDWRFGAIVILVGLIFLSALAPLSHSPGGLQPLADTGAENLWLFAVTASTMIAVVVLGRMFESGKAAEDAVVEKNQRIRKFARLSPVGQYLTDAEGSDVFVNDKWSELTGLKGEGALRDRWEKALHPDDYERVTSEWREAVKNQKNFLMEYRYKRPDGKATWIQSQAIADVADDGRFLGFIGTTTELTAQKQAEDLYRSLLEAAPDAMIVLDANGSITLVNAQAQTLFGYSRAELLSKKIEDLIPARFRTKHYAHRKTFSQNPHARPMGAGLDLCGLRRDGKEFAVEISLGPIETSKGMLISATIRDVTERKDAERTLRELQSELSHASRWTAMGMLASTLAHELNQPMTAVMNYVRASQRILEAHGDTVPPESLDLMTKAIEQTDLAGKIVRNLRRFVEQRETEYDIADINSVVGEVSAAILSEMGRREVNFLFRPSPNLPPVLINRVQIQEVIENLLKNAMEAMSVPNGHELIVETSLTGDGFVEVRVSDSGSGVSPEVADKLFMPFATTKPSGLGVGLAISHSIVIGHGGRLWTEPKSGGGSVFHFTVPIAIAGDDNLEK